MPALLLIGALMAPATLIFAQTRVERGFSLFSVEQDVEIGRQSAEQVEKELPLLRDRRADRYVNEVGKRLAAEAPHGEYPYQFKILNYVLLIAPENDFDRFAAAFDTMLSSLRVDDRVVHRSR